VAQHHATRNILLSCLAAAILAVVGACGLGMVAVWILGMAISQLQFDGIAVQRTLIAATIEQGDVEQKLWGIRVVPDLPSSRDYIPQLILALDDPNAEVREAAAAVLREIDPAVADLVCVP
jgi:hypothetical protein